MRRETFTEVNPDKGTETITSTMETGMHLPFTEVNPDKGTETYQLAH